MPPTVNLDHVNPYVKKANWICAKLKQAGRRALLEEERVFIHELARRAAILDDRLAKRLVDEIQKAHLEFQFTLSTRP